MQLFLLQRPPCYTAHEHMSREHGGFVMSGNVIEIPQRKKLVPIGGHQLKAAVYAESAPAMRNRKLVFDFI